MPQVSHEACAAFVGLAWADATHDVCLQATGSEKRESCMLGHTPETIDAWVSMLPRPGKSPSGRRAGPGVHMDSPSLAVLARAHPGQ